MAEDKKSFILYADLLHTVKKMPNDKAGVLLKTILEYVNDTNPVVEDLMVDLVFEPIKQQLKRDLKNYQGVKEERSRSGRMGNLKRWNEDLHKQVSNNEITLEEAEVVAKSRIAINSDKNLSQNIANVAVNVNDNVNVNDINNNIVEFQKETTTKPKSSIEDRCLKFVTYFNKVKGSASGNKGKYSVTSNVLKLFKLRVKKYSSEQIAKAVRNGFADRKHIEENFKYMTPEFILRENIIERYVNIEEKKDINLFVAP